MDFWFHFSYPPQDQKKKKTRRIAGDGNFLFHTLSHIISGSQNQHVQIRNLVIEYMVQIAHLIIDSFTITDVHEYIRLTRMDRQGAWGTEVEIVTMSHLLDTSIYIYKQETARWVVSTPN